MNTDHRGVFWILDDELLAIPYSKEANQGLSKSGENYNHRELWEAVKLARCNKLFDYYPRGRVEVSNKGKPVIYMNPNIDESYLPEIMEAFKLDETPRGHYDGSDHYKRYIDKEPPDHKTVYQ